MFPSSSRILDDHEEVILRATREDQMPIAEHSDIESERVEEESEKEMVSPEDSDADLTTSAGRGLKPSFDQKWEIRLRDIPGFAQHSTFSVGNALGS